MKEIIGTQVSLREKFQFLRNHFQEKVDLFRGGRLEKYLYEWKKLTSDDEIIHMIIGDTIEFINNTPPIKHKTYNTRFSTDEMIEIDHEIQKLLEHEIIKECFEETNEFISPIFTTRNKDETIRLILNLKHLNKHIEYHHFKMDTINTILQNITPGCYMASLDLKSAYYSVRINPNYQKFLKFRWDNKMYKFTCYPNGLAPCPRKFTKLLKVPLSTLRSKRHIIFGYIDDLHIQGETFEECLNSLLESMMLFDKLGFVIHPKKSEFMPQQRVIFLGFIIDSVHMTVEMTADKKLRIREAILELMDTHKIKIRKVARLVGLLVSSFPASTFGPLYYRYIEREKIWALKEVRGDYNKKMSLSQQAKKELDWWLKNLDKMKANIQQKPITKEMSTDASGEIGWGASMEYIDIGGAWDTDELTLHINEKELLAIYYALLSFKNKLEGKHVRILCDNTTAVAIVNKMGSSKGLEHNEIAKMIWKLCKNFDIWVTCTYIPGVENVRADRESRREYKQGEWKLNPKIFETILDRFNFTPTIDCFASRLNAQIDTYASFRPDPFATMVDAFSFNWNSYYCYIFPPFSMISRVLQKIRIDRATVLCVLPEWKTQAWWPLMLRMSLGQPFRLKPSTKNLILPNKPTEVHPFHKNLTLNACLLSGNIINPKDCLMI